MTDKKRFETLILKRLAALGQRMEEIDAELGRAMSKVLEGLGLAAQQETALLRSAPKRIEDGTDGICRTCGAEISAERLAAVPYAPLCKTCARAAAA